MEPSYWPGTGTRTLVSGREMDVRRARLRQTEEEMGQLNLKLEGLLAEARTLKRVLVVVIPLAVSLIVGTTARLNGAVCSLEGRLNNLLMERPAPSHEVAASIGELQKALAATQIAVARLEERLQAEAKDELKAEEKKGGAGDARYSDR